MYGVDLISIINTFQTGGPYVLAGILYYLWREERKEKLDLRAKHEQLQARLLENSIAQVQATTKMESAIVALKDILNQFLSRMS